MNLILSPRWQWRWLDFYI